MKFRIFLSATTKITKIREILVKFWTLFTNWCLLSQISSSSSIENKPPYDKVKKDAPTLHIDMTMSSPIQVAPSSTQTSPMSTPYHVVDGPITHNRAKETTTRWTCYFMKYFITLVRITYYLSYVYCYWSGSPRRTLRIHIVDHTEELIMLEPVHYDRTIIKN
jgi:hypothetical protein